MTDNDGRSTDKAIAVVMTSMLLIAILYISFSFLSYSWNNPEKTQMQVLQHVLGVGE